MTEQEKKDLKDAVIAELKSEGTDVSQATVITDKSGVSYVICYDNNGNIARITPAELNASDVNSNAVQYSSLHFTSDAEKIILNGKTVDGKNVFGSELLPATTEDAGAMSAEAKRTLDNSIDANSVSFYDDNGRLTLEFSANEGNITNIYVPNATSTTAGVMTADDKKKLDGVESVESINWGIENNLDDYTTEGNYSIGGNNNNGDNIPIVNEGIINARLSVLVTEYGGNKVVIQVLTLNNNTGGEGNVYIRSQQNGTWKPWGKLQTNIEVGAIGLGQSKTFDDLADNGIYSGVNVIQVGTDGNGYPITSYETFVLVVINAYLTGGGISQLKYSLLLDGTTSVMTRTKTDVWGEWSELKGGSSSVKPATMRSYGTVKLGTPEEGSSALLGSNACPVTMINNPGDDKGLGFIISNEAFFVSGGVLFPKLGSGLEFNEGINIKIDTSSGLYTNSNGLGLKIDTAYNGDATKTDIIPAVYGRISTFEAEGIGIPVNINGGLEYTENGLEVKNLADITQQVLELNTIDAIPLLITRGVIKPGTEYMLKFLRQDFLFTINSKVDEHINSKAVSSSDTIYIFLRWLTALGYSDDSLVIDCYILSTDLGVIYYKYIISNFSKGRGIVLVSSDMTEL